MAKNGKKDKQEPPLPTVDDHPLVAHLELKPETPAHLVTLTGYPAASDDDDYFRLYLDRHFQSYYEIPRKHFVNQWRSDPTDDKAPHHVAIKGEATPRLVVLVHKRVSSSAAALLQGPMVSAHLASAIDSGLIWTAPDPTQPPPPPPHGRMGVLGYLPGGAEPIE
jgi:hypothetical protein